MIDHFTTILHCHTPHSDTHKERNRTYPTMFASRNNHAFRVHQHQPDKENMIAQTPLRPGGMPFKTPMTQRTLQPSTSKAMFGTVGPKRMQTSGKDGSKTELRPRVGPSLIREASNVGEGASPFAGKGKGKGVELGKSQQLGGKDGGSNLVTNLGKSIVLFHAFSQSSKDPSSNLLTDRALSRLTAPKRLFTSTKTPLKQTAPPSSFQNPLPPVSSTPLPSASRSRRRSRQSLNQSQSQSPSNDKNSLLKTPGPARLNLESDKFKTPCRPSSSFHNGYSLYSPGDQDLLEDEEEEDDEDTPAHRGAGGSAAGGLSLRQELVARSGGVDLGTDSGMDLGLGMGMEMMQLNVQEVQEEEDEIEYMPPRAQGEPLIQTFSLFGWHQELIIDPITAMIVPFSLSSILCPRIQSAHLSSSVDTIHWFSTSALPDEPPFDYTPLETIGRSLLGAIKGDYLLPHPEDEEEDFDGFVNGQKWDVLDLDLGDERVGGVGDQEEQGSEEEGEGLAGRKVSANGMRMIGEPTSGLVLMPVPEPPGADDRLHIWVSRGRATFLGESRSYQEEAGTTGCSRKGSGCERCDAERNRGRYQGQLGAGIYERIASEDHLETKDGIDGWHQLDWTSTSNDQETDADRDHQQASIRNSDNYRLEIRLDHQ
jgi:hypothetical protein